MPAPSLIFDEAASLDALRQFVTTAIPEVPTVDVYRSRPPASPGKWGLSVLLRPLTPAPIHLSPMGEESTAKQAQRVRVTVTTAAVGTWTLRVLGQAATYEAPGDATATTVRDGLSMAVFDLGLPVTVTDNVGAPPSFDILADTAGASMLVALTAKPAGGAATVAVIDDNLRRCVYNWGQWTIRVIVRDIDAAQGAAPSMVAAYIERLRFHMQATSLPVVNGSAYPYVRDRLVNARMNWRQTLGPFDADVVEGNVWHRGAAIDLVFDVPVGLLHDVPSLDTMGQTGPATLT